MTVLLNAGSLLDVRTFCAVISFLCACGLSVICLHVIAFSRVLSLSAFPTVCGAVPHLLKEGGVAVTSAI